MLIAVLALTGAAGCDRQPESVHRQLLAFGTLVEITVHTRHPERARAGIERLGRALDRWHRAWHPWEGDGLARINRRLATGQPAEVPPELARMLRQARRYQRLSGGRFDPGIGALVRLWGFHRDDSEPQRPPPEAALARWRSDPASLLDLRLTDGLARADRRDLQLDLGGFAKGYALDRAIELLREAGIEQAIVNAGGDLRVLGRRGERPWRVGIRAPRGDGVFAALSANDGEAVFTSGDYERYFRWQGRRYHHILDPRAGVPARGLRSVTVVANSGGLADAAATALFVAGPQWPAVAHRLGVDQVMAVTATGTVALTPAMARRIRFMGQRPERIVEVPWP